MIKLTSHAIELIRLQIERKPINSDELRRVQGLGNLFMSRTRFQSEDGEFEREGWTHWEIYSMKIDGVVYYFYGGSPLHLGENDN